MVLASKLNSSVHVARSGPSKIMQWQISTGDYEGMAGKGDRGEMSFFFTVLA